MKKADEMKPEYDFSTGQRGRYAGRYTGGTNLVVLSPDLAAVFPDSDSVNEALLRKGLRNRNAVFSSTSRLGAFFGKLTPTAQVSVGASSGRNW